MSLACLACNGAESSPEVMRSYSSRSDTEVTCCWTKKSHPPPTQDLLASTMGSRVVPDPPRPQMALGPRLTRCRAVRRDLVVNWNFEEEGTVAVSEPDWRNANVVPIVR